MRICQVTYSGFGGLGSVVFSLVAGDPAANEWSIAFIGDQDVDEGYAKKCEALGVRYAAFKSVPGRPYRAWISLARWLGHTRPDVVICHSINSVLPCRWYAWFNGATLLSVEHTANAVKRRSEWAASRLSMLLADRVIVLTQQYANELQQEHGWIFRPGKVTLAPNGIDVSLFNAKRTTRRSSNLVRIGMAGRFSFSKLQGLLVQVAEQVAIDRPSWQVELSLAGDGDHYENVKSFAAEHARTARVEFEGLLDEDQMAHWFGTLDLYVHATEAETLSTSLLQAMASGVPIIASDVPGVRNLLGPFNEFGVCVPNTIGAFASAIVVMTENQGTAADMAVRARRCVEEKYSLMAMWKNYSCAIAGG